MTLRGTAGAKVFRRGREPVEVPARLRPGALPRGLRHVPLRSRLPVTEAMQGKLLGHNVTGGRWAGPLLRKGRALTADDVAALVALGRATVYVAEPGQGDVA